MYYIGLDVHKRTISCCVKDAAGRVHMEGKIGSTRRELDGWLRILPQPRTIAMEATIFTGWIYDHLLPHAEKVKVAHPLMLRAIAAAKRKNDKVDASKIADCLRCDFLPECHMASTEIRDRRRTLRYPDEILKELDYTVCSIHSRFGLDRDAQTERLLRAMDNRYFNILGHATGQLLLKRPGYEIDIDRVIGHARANGCFLEINSSPDRLDVSADTAHQAAAAGVFIAVSTDAHSTGELGLIRCGLDQARRAGLGPSLVLNSQPWPKLKRLFSR